MDEEHLIEYVRQYEVLYELSNPKYMNTYQKIKLWMVSYTLKYLCLYTIHSCAARKHNITMCLYLYILSLAHNNILIYLLLKYN